jgi:hypothetical protein
VLSKKPSFTADSRLERSKHSRLLPLRIALLDQCDVRLHGIFLSHTSILVPGVPLRHTWFQCLPTTQQLHNNAPWHEPPTEQPTAASPARHPPWLACTAHTPQAFAHCLHPLGGEGLPSNIQHRRQSSLHDGGDLLQNKRMLVVLRQELQPDLTR